MTKINFSKEAQKFFLKLNSPDQKKISKAIGKIIKDPLIGEKLKGEYEGLFKLYAWPYRVIYSFDRIKKTVLVVTIGHRQGVYK
ncbi:type II toxin-antitoxin system RelE/ParE family toxin [Candidatus Daviesbacteria bacterium]|nr:type II toxin-antitoxin system RelE/ParE family toxin [Candidatus Daviesbacteria bacterium]